MAALIFIALAVIYTLFDPATVNFFPSCPFHSMTGLLCPGCGSQRAVHHLLNLQFTAAFHQNALLIVSMPYVLTGFVIDRLPQPSPVISKYRQIFYGRNAIFLILFIIFSFWIIRNLF